MAKFEEFCQLSRDFARSADFLTIYIEEAHPKDGWAFQNNINIQHHQNLSNRITAAKILHKYDSNAPIVVDTMTDEANIAYGGLSERLYIIWNGKIVYAGELGPNGYNLDDIKNWLCQHTGQF
jgi:hypothetical protein